MKRHRPKQTRHKTWDVQKCDGGSGRKAMRWGRSRKKARVAGIWEAGKMLQRITREPAQEGGQ